jgi:hypothetical protein
MLNSAKASTAFNRQAHVSQGEYFIPVLSRLFTKSNPPFPLKKKKAATYVRGNIAQNYNFFIVNDGIDKQNSLLRTPNKNNHFRRLSLQQSPEGRLRNRKTSVSASIPVVPDSGADAKNNGSLGDPDVDEVDALASSLSALKFVPASVTRRLEFDRRRTEEG